MKKAVFPENVVEGLNRWRANARKNVALKSKLHTSARPSLDASSSLDTTPSPAGTSPSFSLGASFSKKINCPSSDSDEYLAVEIKDEEKEINVNRETREDQKGDSFGGFDVRKIT